MNIPFVSMSNLDGKQQTMGKLLSLCLAVMAPGLAMAQTPKITNSPASAKPGQIIQILGTDFSSVPESNIVHFGAVKGVVTSGDGTSLSVAVPHGAVHGPITVTINGRTAYSPKLFFPAFNGSGSSEIAFAPRIALTSGANTVGVALGDINGDGKPEIAAANFGTTTVSVFKNATAGGITTSSFSTVTNVQASLRPRFSAVGDVDGDGKLDLVAASHDGHVVSVFHNVGVGDNIALAPRVDFPTGLSTYAVSIGDLDADGKPDLVLANAGSDTISILRNTSSPGVINSNSFAPRFDIPTADWPTKASLCDVDGDGRVDLLVANDGATVSVFRNTISAPGPFGSSSFAPRVDFPTAGRPQDAVAADLDGDGKPDLAIPAYAGGAVSVLKNLSTVGNISFAPKFDLFTGGSTHCVAFGDVDGNGRLDIVAVSEWAETAAVFRNVGADGVLSAGSFATRISFPAGHNPGGVAVGDLDHDGRPEIVAGNYNGTVSVLRNLTSEGPLSLRIISAPVSAQSGQTIDISGTGFNGETAGNVVYFGAVRGTVVSANSTNLSVIVPAGAVHARITVTVDGRTVASPAFFFPSFPGEGTFTSASFAPRVALTSGANTVGTALADFNNDGKSEILAANYGTNTVTIFRNGTTDGITASSFSTRSNFPVGLNPRFAATADVDGDGNLDFVAANHNSAGITVYQNRAVGTNLTFSPRVNFQTGGTPYTVAIGDLDGDGRLDLVTANAGGSSLSLLRNISTVGVISSNSFAPRVSIPCSATPTKLSLVDVDGDGRLDVVVANDSPTSTVSIFRNLISAPGAFTSNSLASRVDFATGSRPQDVVAADLDSDGRPDLAVPVYGSAAVSVLKNLSSPGNVAFAPRFDLPTGGSTHCVAFGDVDGNGKVDIIAVSEWAETAAVFRNVSVDGLLTANSFAPRVDFPAGHNPGGVCVGDLDNDGRPDIIAGNYNGTVSVLRNEAAEVLLLPL